jgi:hypothetical protein
LCLLVLCCDTLQSISSKIVLGGLPYVAVLHQLLPAVPIIMLLATTGQQLHIQQWYMSSNQVVGYSLGYYLAA